MGKPTEDEIEADNESRTTSTGMYRYALEYFGAAVAANDEIGDPGPRRDVAPMPVNFLLGQSIELALKAYLRERGFKLKVLRKLGHDLSETMKVAQNEGLKVDGWSRGIEAQLELLSVPYKARELQYIRTGAKTFPTIDPLLRLVATIVYSVAPHVPHGPVFFRGDGVGKYVLRHKNND
jgi:hypothetical protein